MSVASAIAVAFKPVAPSGEAVSNAPADDAFAGLVAEATASDTPSKPAPTTEPHARPSTDKPAHPLNAVSALAVSALAVQALAKAASGDAAQPAQTLPAEAANDAEAPTTDGTTTVAATPDTVLDQSSASTPDAPPAPVVAPAAVVPAPTLLVVGTDTAPAAPVVETSTPTGSATGTPTQVPAPVVPATDAPPPPLAATPDAALNTAQAAAVEAALVVPAALLGARAGAVAGIDTAAVAPPIRNASTAKAEQTTASTATSSAPPTASQDASSTASASAPASSATAPQAMATPPSFAAQQDASAAASTPVADTAIAAPTQDAADPGATPVVGASPPPAPSASATSAAFMTGTLSQLSQTTLETTVQIAAQISSKLAGRSTRFEMGLTPEGLGRVDVSLDIDANGQLQARLAFDNPLAATELRGRADELRRQLETAGFTIAPDGFQFTDRQPSSSGNGFDRQQGRAFASASRLNADADLSPSAPAAWVSLSLTPRGVDMKV